MKNQSLPAVSIALVDDQQVVWAQGFGFADPASKTSGSGGHNLPRWIGFQALYRYRDHATGRRKDSWT